MNVVQTPNTAKIGNTSWKVRQGRSVVYANTHVRIWEIDGIFFKDFLLQVKAICSSFLSRYIQHGFDT